MLATLPSGAEVMLPSTRRFDVSSAGQLPTGFDPGALYASRNHPRALQMTVFAMSDALADLGIDWNTLSQSCPQMPSAFTSPVRWGSSMKQVMAGC